MKFASNSANTASRFDQPELSSMRYHRRSFFPFGYMIPVRSVYGRLMAVAGWSRFDDAADPTDEGSQREALKEYSKAQW